jgi:hypothetical protein
MCVFQQRDKHADSNLLLHLWNNRGKPMDLNEICLFSKVRAFLDLLVDRMSPAPWEGDG